MPFNRINQRYGEKHGFPKVIAWDKLLKLCVASICFNVFFMFKTFVITLSILNPHVLAWYLERSQGAISIVGAEGKRFLSALQFSECQDSAPTKPLIPTFDNHKPLGFQKTGFSSLKSSLPEFFHTKKKSSAPSFGTPSLYGSFASQRLSKQPR